ncbi:MAG TPA: hypothetical protein VF219_22880, partial [Vicinamibacterales bacterium]
MLPRDEAVKSEAAAQVACPGRELHALLVDCHVDSALAERRGELDGPHPGRSFRLPAATGGSVHATSNSVTPIRN